MPTQAIFHGLSCATNITAPFLIAFLPMTVIFWHCENCLARLRHSPTNRLRGPTTLTHDVPCKLQIVTFWAIPILFGKYGGLTNRQTIASFGLCGHVVAINRSRLTT